MVKLERGSSRQWATFCLLIAILLGGMALRFGGLEAMRNMLNGDEAYEGLDALSLLHTPRLTPFLPGNHGRESAWAYYLVPFIAVLGTRSSALRLAAMVLGTLTLPMVYALGKEILGGRGGLWAMGTLSVLYWHVHLSHVALRPIVVPLLGALAFTLLLRAYRDTRTPQWAAAGLAVGSLGYCYFAGYAWIVYTLLLLAWWALRDQERRRGALVAILVIILVLAPMGAYVLLRPGQVFDRIRGVGTPGIQAVLNNVRLWIGAWFWEGDQDPFFNIPGRPILDAAVGALMIFGLMGLPSAVKRRWHTAWLLGLALFAVSPSVMSTDAPHSLRGIGLVLPIALVGGAGATTLERLARRVAGLPMAAMLPVVLLASSALVTSRDFYSRWLNSPEAFLRLAGPLNQAISLAERSTVDGCPVYFSPFSPDDPVLRFRTADWRKRQVSAFDTHCCSILPDRPATWVLVTADKPELAPYLSWSKMDVIMQTQPAEPGRPWYTLLRVEPEFRELPEQTDGAIVFGDSLEVRPLAPVPSSGRASEVIDIPLRIRPLRPLDRAYSIFIHLYGNPTVYEGGPLWSQGDSQICISTPSQYWKRGEAIVQEFRLPIPPSLPDGRYTIAMGVYETQGGARLPVTAPSPQKWDYFPLQDIVITHDRRFNLPEVQHPLDAILGGFAWLRGFRLDDTTVSAHEQFQLTLYWQSVADQPPVADYTVFTHLVDASGRVIAQHDGPPSLGLWPTSSWARSQVIVDNHTLVFLDHTYRGDAFLEVGLYELQSGKRLTTTHGDDKVVLPIRVHVQP